MGAGMAAGMPKSSEAVLGAVEAYKAQGVETLVFCPTDNNLRQVDALYTALGCKTTSSRSPSAHDGACGRPSGCRTPRLVPGCGRPVRCAIALGRG